MEGKLKILVKGQRFEVSLAALCERSDYFLMNYLYSGKNYDEGEISLDLIDVESMELIVKYVESGMNVNDLSDYTLTTIGNFAEAANLLQFSELSEIIETLLTLREITTENWIELIKLAENNNYVKLRQLCIEFGVPPLKDMGLHCVPNMHDLFWYLSQTQLFATNEFEVFQFGLDWMVYYEVDIDPRALLMILGCLDMKRVTGKDLLAIQSAFSQFGATFNNSLAAQVVGCLAELSKCNQITSEEIVAKKSIVKEKYSEEVYSEVLILVESSRTRNIQYIPTVSVLTPKAPPKPCKRVFSRIINFREPSRSVSPEQLRPILLDTHYNYWGDYNDAGFAMYRFTNRGLERWLELKIPKLKIYYDYNWDVAAWGPRSLVLVLSRSKKAFLYVEELNAIDTYAIIKVYNVLKKKWTEYNTVLPNVLVERLAVVRDSLFIITFENNIIFDLKNSSYKSIASLPYAKRDITRIDTRIPLICVHDDKVLVSDLTSIHRYEATSDEWVKVIDRHISNMVSNDDGYVYVTDVVSNTVCRFRPDIDAKMEVVGKFDEAFNPMINLCALGNQLVSFTNKDHDTLSIQAFDLKAEAGGEVIELWRHEYSDLIFDPYTSACRLLLDEPSIDFDLTEYHRKCIRDREEQK